MKFSRHENYCLLREWKVVTFCKFDTDLTAAKSITEMFIYENVKYKKKYLSLKYWWLLHYEYYPFCGFPLDLSGKV